MCHQGICPTSFKWETVQQVRGIEGELRAKDTRTQARSKPF